MGYEFLGISFSFIYLDLELRSQQPGSINMDKQKEQPCQKCALPNQRSKSGALDNNPLFHRTAVALVPPSQQSGQPKTLSWRLSHGDSLLENYDEVLQTPTRWQQRPSKKLDFSCTPTSNNNPYHHQSEETRKEPPPEGSK